jgi:hypothetical protein
MEEKIMTMEEKMKDNKITIKSSLILLGSSIIKTPFDRLKYIFQTQNGNPLIRR